MRYLISLFLVLSVFGLALADNTEQKKPAETEKTEKQDTTKKAEEYKNPLVLMKTNYGDITIEVFQKDVPIHANNFLKLVDEGFYDSLTFHRVVPNFVIQGGDPLGNGTGGAPGKLADDPSSPYKHDRGTIAMARGPEGASTSQFYINLKNNYFLDKQGFLIFAKVVKGMDVVDKIAKVKTNKMDKPVEPVIMTKVTRIK